MKLDTSILERDSERLGIRLSLAQLDQFRQYYRGLIEGNTRTNLTTVTEWEDVQNLHFTDSLTLAGEVPAETLLGGRFVDIGTGAGFPGIPLKIAFPDMQGTLIEATSKKVDFLLSVIRDLELSGIEVCHGRAETLGHEQSLREQFDLVTARAVAAMPVLAELTLPFCRVGGQVVLHKTTRAAREIESADYAIDVLGGGDHRVIDAESGGSKSDKTLVVIDKARGTPSNYPRRPGMPAKRPLTSSI